jgi:hypothetical protein
MTKRKKRKKTLSEKLSKADSFLDTGKFNGKDYDDMFELCEKLLSDDLRKAKFLKGILLCDPSKLKRGWVEPRSKSRWEKEYEAEWVEPDGKSPYDRIDEEIHKSNPKDYAKQITLAFALSILSKDYAKKAEKAEEFIKLIKKLAPTAWLKVSYEINIRRFDPQPPKKELSITRKGLKKLKELQQKRKCEDWDRDFNWYAPHTAKEIATAVKVHPDTIRKHFQKPKGRTTSVKAANTFQYSANEMIKVMEWWLWDYLLGKCNWFQIHLFVLEILETEWFKHLSKTEEEKIRKVLEEPVRPKTGSANVFSPFDRR